MQKGNNNNWLKKLSPRSLQKIKAILEITLSELEIIGINQSKKEYSIVNRVFNKENFSLVEVKDVINNLNRELSIDIKTAKSRGLLMISMTKSLKNTQKSKPA